MSTVGLNAIAVWQGRQSPSTTSIYHPLALRGEMRAALATISGKWKLQILGLLNQRIHRFGEFRCGIPGITQHMLTAQLRELEADGLVSREIFAEIPPRVVYANTPTVRAPLSTQSSHRGGSMEAPHRRATAFDGLLLYDC